MRRIIYDSWGQMCNRLWEYLDQVAWAYKTNNKVISWFWDYSLEDFDNLRKNDYIKFPFYIKYSQNSLIARLYQYVLKRTLCNNFLRKVYSSVIFKKRGFISSKDILFEHEHYSEVWHEIKGIFMPNKQITERIDPLFARMRHNEIIKIVGVHIRKGDYKNYCGGRFYYSDDEYRDYMRQILMLIDGEVYFFIASNEKINRSKFEEFALADIVNSKPAEDMYCLSKCDYIIGPYSSFSYWASFFNSVPLCTLFKGRQIKMEDFRIISSFEHAPESKNK